MELKLFFFHLSVWIMHFTKYIWGCPTTGTWPAHGNTDVAVIKSSLSAWKRCRSYPQPPPYSPSSQVISPQMGSAVPIHCQKHWTSNTAARGHVASFIHEASSPACAGRKGESFCYPSWERRRLRETTCTFNFLGSPVICFFPYWNSSLFPQRGYLAIAREGKFLFKQGLSERWHRS